MLKYKVYMEMFFLFSILLDISLSGAGSSAFGRIFVMASLVSLTKFGIVCESPPQMGFNQCHGQFLSEFK